MFFKLRFRRIAALFVLLFISFGLSAASFFTRNLSGTANGAYRLAGGYLPVSFSVARSQRIRILPEGDEKATLSISSSYSLSNTGESFYFNKATGTPLTSWLNNGITDSDSSITYFNPTGSLSLSLSQKMDDWTYTVSLSSRYSLPQEDLRAASGTSSELSFSKYDGSSWTKKYQDKEDVYAYPWLYGERTNLTSWITIGASRSIYTIKNLSSFSLSLSFRMGPWWMLNRISNDGITLSDYYRIGASCSQSMLLKDEKQSISLRWLRIYLSHSNSFSYTFGKTVPQNELNSFRLRGVLSDTVSLSLQGPEMYDGETAVSMNVNYSNALYFGGFENEKSAQSRGMAYVSSLSTSMNLKVFGFISFGYSIVWNIAGGYTSSSSLYASGEVSMSLSL